jgi:hypothetical protein
VKQSHVTSAIHKASKETSHLLSAHVRNEAHASGWPTHVARSLNVTHSADGFAVHAHSDHHAEALNHEYGTPGTQPNRAVHRATNRLSPAEHFFVKRLFKHIEGAL